MAEITGESVKPLPVLYFMIQAGGRHQCEAGSYKQSGQQVTRELLAVEVCMREAGGLADVSTRDLMTAHRTGT